MAQVIRNAQCVFCITLDNKKEKLIIAKLNNVRLCLEAHPHNVTHSEFDDRISDLYEIIEDLKNNKFNIQLKNKFPECSDEVYESKINFE